MLLGNCLSDEIQRSGVVRLSCTNEIISTVIRLLSPIREGSLSYVHEVLVNRSVTIAQEGYKCVKVN